MKKRNLSSLALNKKSIAGFAHQVQAGYASSGLNMSCPNICKATKEGILCEDLDLPSPIASDSPVPSEETPADAPADSPAG